MTLLGCNAGLISFNITQLTEGNQPTAKRLNPSAQATDVERWLRVGFTWSPRSGTEWGLWQKQGGPCQGFLGLGGRVGGSGWCGCGLVGVWLGGNEPNLRGLDWWLVFGWLVFGWLGLNLNGVFFFFNQKFLVNVLRSKKKSGGKSMVKGMVKRRVICRAWYQTPWVNCIKNQVATATNTNHMWLVFFFEMRNSYFQFLGVALAKLNVLGKILSVPQPPAVFASVFFGNNTADGQEILESRPG